MNNHHSLSCKCRSAWHSCCNRNCSNACGCTASDGTPACNPCAPWNSSASSCSTGWQAGNCYNSTPCGISSATACGGCSHSPCSCGNCWWGQCSDWNNAVTLTPRYVAIGRTFQRRITQTLCVNDLPECAESPLTLVAVTVCGQASWEQISECRQQLLRVTVPVVLQIRDCAGRCRTGHAAVTLTIPLCANCPAQELWRGQLYVAPCIRLAAPVTENEDGCFDATLEVQAEVYHVRMQALQC